MILSVFSSFPGFWIPIGITLVAAIILVIFLNFRFKKNSIFGLGDAIGFGIIWSMVVGFVLLMISISQSSSHHLNQIERFEEFYNVAITNNSEIPQTRNQQEAVMLFLVDEGPTACIVSTDDVRYSVNCNGEELPQVGS